MTSQDTSIVTTISIAMMERYTTEHGHFCLLDWLLAENLLDYSAYEAWRYGKQQDLDASFAISRDSLQQLIANISQDARALGLISEPHDYFLWSDSAHKRLCASQTKALHDALTQHWLRAQDAPQLDLFMDNSAVFCENDIHAALAGRQFVFAQTKLQQLTLFNAKHRQLGNYQDLVNYGLHMQATEILNTELLANEIHALEHEVLPLARETLASNARDYLAFAWRRLGKTAQTFAFNPQQPQLDASYSLMQIPDWQAALEHLQALPVVFESAALLQRLAQCHERLAHHSDALIIWCLLFEFDSTAAEAAIEAKLSQPIWMLWQDFWDINDGGIKTFFPAFVLIKNPGLLHHLHKFPALTSHSSNAMIQMLKVQMANENQIAARETLQNISPALLRLYLNGRK